MGKGDRETAKFCPKCGHPLRYDRQADFWWCANPSCGAPYLPERSEAEMADTRESTVHEYDTGEPQPFTATDALDAAQEWVFKNTRLGWLSIIGVILVGLKLFGQLDGSWFGALWPFFLVAGTLLVVALVFHMRYDVKFVIEVEVEAAEHKDKLVWGKKWNSSGLERVVLEISWMKKE